MCTCIDEFNEKAAEHNTELTVTLFSRRPLLETQKVDTKKRGKPVGAIASYCPFCGEKYGKYDGLAQ